MGKLRMVPKHKEPGFIEFEVDEPGGLADTERETATSHLSVVMPHGTVVQVNPQMSLRQIARLVKLLEAGRGLG